MTRVRPLVLATLVLAGCSFDPHGLPLGGRWDGGGEPGGRDAPADRQPRPDTLMPDTLMPDMLQPDTGPPFKADIWVSPTGNDSPCSGTCGTFMSPCQTIAKGLTMCSGGKTVGLLAGTYNENVTVPANCNLQGAGRDLVTIMGGGSGAGPVVSVNGNSDISGMTITGGVVDGSGGKPDDGGGLYWQNGAGVVHDVTITGNTATDNGGGVRVSNGTVTIERSFIWFNTATGSGGGNGGAGIAVSNGAVTLLNDVIANNTATNQGGGLYLYGGTVSVAFCTFSNNAAATGGAIDVTGGALSTLDSTILWGDKAATGPETNGTIPAPKDCDIQNLTTTLNMDPGFDLPTPTACGATLIVTSPPPDYGLKSCSEPPAGRGNPSGAPGVDVNDLVRKDSPPTMGAYDCHD